MKVTLISAALVLLGTVFLAAPLVHAQSALEGPNYIMWKENGVNGIAVRANEGGQRGGIESYQEIRQRKLGSAQVRAECPDTPITDPKRGEYNIVWQSCVGPNEDHDSGGRFLRN